jgi:indole-3-acetate monooxygenase
LRIFSPANAVLAWGAGIQGKAIECDGGYRVTGKWSFSSGSRHATVLGGHSFVYEADGVTQCFHPDGRKVDRTAIFERAKATVYDVWDVMGLRGTGSDTFEVNDLFVPWDETVDREDQAAVTDPSPIYRIPTSLVYAVGFSSLQVGIARAMLEELRGLAMDKRPRGAASVLRESPVFQGQLARFEAKLRMIRASILFTADEVYNSVAQNGPITLDERVALRLTCTNAINEAVAVSTDIYRAAGATAIFPSNPFERRLRDALTASQQVQARADHYENVGRHLLGLPPNSTMFL